MKLVFGALMLMLVVVIEGNKNDKEINLNFQQNDYQLKFERMELPRYNKQFMIDASIVTFKFNRTTPLTNTTLTFKTDTGTDLVSIVQAYKFMSNEYRLFPLHFAANSCKAITANVAGIISSIKCGNFTGCPFAKGKKYHICNWYPDQSKFPPYLPNGQYKIEIQVVHGPTELFVVNAYATVFRPIQ